MPGLPETWKEREENKDQQINTTCKIRKLPKEDLKGLSPKGTEAINNVWEENILVLDLPQTCYKSSGSAALMSWYLCWVGLRYAVAFDSPRQSKHTQHLTELNLGELLFWFVIPPYLGAQELLSPLERPYNTNGIWIGTDRTMDKLERSGRCPS